MEGSVTLEREGRIDDAPANMPLLAGDRVRTKNGRAEILFADGSTLHLDQDSTLDLQSDELVRLIGGRLRLSIPGPSRDVAYRIDTATGTAQIVEAGEYRAAFVRDELELAVIRGRAELINDGGRTPLRAGERAFARANAAPSYAYVFNSAAWDAFDRWSEDRRSERIGVSTQYLPEEVRPYAASFDRYGSWRYEAAYGNVWYPRVDIGWRPYYYGRWVPYRPYGVTWVSSHAWGWPTHHYGRWGFSGGAWFWIPGRTWASAWVSWAHAPGYVSWCPLGWNNRPVVQFVNVHNYYGRNPWHAWTVVPHRSFTGAYVHRSVVAGHRIDDRTRAAFVQRDRVPDGLGYAVPRGSASAAPIRVAGTRGRTAATPLLTNRGASAEGSRPMVTPARGYREAGTPVANSPRGESAAARRIPAAGLNSPRGESSPNRRVPTAGLNSPRGESAVERTVPSRPMTRSERPTAGESPRADVAQPPYSRAVPRSGTDHPVYQPRAAEPVRSRNDSPGGDASVYRREDGYRARPETYSPGGSGGRAVPRGDYGRPAAPSYGPPPSYGAPPSYGGGSGPTRNPGPGPTRGGGERPGPSASQPPAPSGGSNPSAGSRPSSSGGSRPAVRRGGH